MGARYDGTYPGSTKVGDCGPKTGSGATFSVAYKTFLRQYWEAQVRRPGVEFSVTIVNLSSRLFHTRKVPVGFNGRGRLRTRMSGHIRQGWNMDGYLRTPLIINTQISVGDRY